VFSGGSGVFGAAFFIFEVMRNKPVGPNDLDLEQYQCRQCGRLAAKERQGLEGGSSFLESRLVALVEVKMNSVELAAKGLPAVWQAEIERAVDNVKMSMVPGKRRTEFGKWFRRQWYREAALTKKYGKDRPWLYWRSRQR